MPPLWSIISEMKRNFLIFVGIAAMLFSCKHEIPQIPVDPDAPVTEVDDCDPGVIYFQQEVLPIFQSSCAMPGCHDQATAQDGIVLDSYANIMGSGEVVPGTLDDGDVFENITESDPDDIMPPPPNEPLTADQINVISEWILQGASNTSCEALSCDTVDVAFSTHVEPFFVNTCEGCHSGPSPNAGLSLVNYDQISAIALDGSLWHSVNGSSGFTLMPYNGTPLSECELVMLDKWIENGAPND